MCFGHNKIFLLLAIMLYLSKYTKGSCEITDLPQPNGVCVGWLQCDQVISADLTSWGCIKSSETFYEENYDYGYYQRLPKQRVTYATNYKLYVSVQNVDDEHDIFGNVKIINIQYFEIVNGRMLALPQKVYQLSEATDIEISNNQLSAVDLNRFTVLPQLTTITLRNNLISTLEMEAQAEAIQSRSIETIDLSQNLLKSVPNTCFSRFTDLQHLNLSHNLIRNFDILTFEGVMELKTIDVSHNMLLEIGNSFTRFINLEELYLQNNNLTNLAAYHLNTLLKLEKLNLSSNVIDQIENNTFKNLLQLKYLDLSNNLLETIPKTLFEKNYDLHSLTLSKNRINHIQDGAFDGKNITDFNIQDNIITGSIEQDTFKGVHVENLDLSNGRITSLGNETFKYMCEDLNSLNASFNKINTIAHSAFSCLDLLTNLDLSHNNIENFDFVTSSLSNLLVLNVSYNNVKEITKNTLNNLTALKKIDLTHNEIREIQLQSFLAFKNIDDLTVAHNPFVNILENNTFDGLIALETIDLSFTRTTSYQNGSFSGLPALKHINSSFGQLSNIAYNAFIQTGSIVKLDLSHNLLDKFCINTSAISKIEEIYLNDNTIRHIADKTFSGLNLLRILNLVNNNVQKIEAYAFKTTEKLSYLYLSSNTQMKVIGNPFDNLTNLYQLNMDGIKTGFTFQNATSVEIVNLDLHSCGIRDLNKLFVFMIGNLRELDLSSNEILTIDKFSFQNMPNLIKLDMSTNRINFIQPGSFLHLNSLRKLTLSGNNLQTLQFGVFDGIKALSYINISSNALQIFDAKILPNALFIALDNNDISILNFEDFFESQTNKLSIGGNQISCKVLVELKTSKNAEKFKEIVTTASLDFHSENVDGISCQSSPKDNGMVLPVPNNSSYDIRPVFIQFTNAVNNLRSSIDIVGNNTSPEKDHQIKSVIQKIVESITSLKSDIPKIVESIHALIDISNQTQIQTRDYQKRFENNTNTTQILEDIKENLINFTDKIKKSREYYDANDAKKSDINDGIRSEIKIMHEEIVALRDEFEKTFQNIQKRDPTKLLQVSEKESKNDRVLYFIAGSLGLIIVLYVSNVAYSYFKSYRSSTNLHNSRRPIASDMEME